DLWVLLSVACSMGWSCDERIAPRRWRQAKLDGFFMRFPVVETAGGADRGLARREHECSRKILRSDQDGSVDSPSGSRGIQAWCKRQRVVGFPASGFAAGRFLTYARAGGRKPTALHYSSDMAIHSETRHARQGRYP